MFDQDTVQRVWEKGRKIPGADPNLFRYDEFGTWMLRSEYGSQSSILGWDIDHILPELHGGSDDFDNLRPVQWQNLENRREALV